jgi:hypothetical protein
MSGKNDRSFGGEPATCPECSASWSDGHVGGCVLEDDPDAFDADAETYGSYDNSNDQGGSSSSSSGGFLSWLFGRN